MCTATHPTWYLNLNGVHSTSYTHAPLNIQYVYICALTACTATHTHTHSSQPLRYPHTPSHTLLHPAAMEPAPLQLDWLGAQACQPGRMAPCRWSSCGAWLQRSSLSWTLMMDLAPGQSPVPGHRAELPWGGPPALTGGAQQALNAAINLHHGGLESERGVRDRRYVSGNEVWVCLRVVRCVVFMCLYRRSILAFIPLKMILLVKTSEPSEPVKTAPAFIIPI